jgi:hypothetical protein
MTPESLRARAAELRRLADELDATASLVAPPGPAELLNLARLRAEFGFSRESLLSAAQRGLAVHRGPRGRLCSFRTDVEAWIRSRAWTPSKAREAEAPDDALARAEAELMAGGGLYTRRNSQKQLGLEHPPETPDKGPRDSAHLRRVK